MRFFIAFLICAAVLLGVHSPGAAAAQGIITPAPSKKPLTNQDVVQLVGAKFADSTVAKVIEANQTAFDVSPSALIALKDSGVSQTVIEAMLSAGAPKGTSSATQAETTVEKRVLDKEPSGLAGPTTSVYADKWDTAEIKDCKTYGNKPFHLFCDEDKTEWPYSHFNLVFNYEPDRRLSPKDAAKESFRHATQYEVMHGIEYRVKFSGDKYARRDWLVDDPWPNLQARETAISRFSQMDLPEKMTLWSCSKDSQGITCDFKGTDDPLLEKKSTQ